MDKTILQYQKAFKSIIERLKNNDYVLSVMVFGSMVTGDLWDESDIDMFVITRNTVSEIKNIYTEEKGVPVHIKMMGKVKFLQLHDEDLRGGFIHRIFASSKLVFSKDVEITSRYDNGRYYPDLDRERWTMVYLGNVIKNVSISKKYLSNNGLYTAYSAAVRAVEDYAKLYINSSGYLISNDATIMAMNNDDSFKACVDTLYLNKVNIREAIEKTMTYLQNAVNLSMFSNTQILVNFMKEKDCFLSSEEIKNDKLFVNFDISLEEILNKLWEKNIIKKETRDYKTDDGKVMFKENVYFI
jgi:uncharacterized protein